MLDGRIALTTPEGVRLLLTPAGPLMRGSAWCIDFFVWAGAASVVAGILASTKLGLGLLFILMFLSYWGYPVLCEVYANGQTLGKRICAIRVLRADGLPVGWRQSLLRNLMLVADFLPALYVSGLLSILFDARFRRLGDIVAGTIVVYCEPRPRAPLAIAGEPLPLPFTLSAAQQRTLIDLFEREPGLPPDRMDELGSIAAALTGSSGAASVERLRGMAAGLTR